MNWLLSLINLLLLLSNTLILAVLQRGADLQAAWKTALACDPVSAFGGIVAINRTLDAPLAKAITAIFTEVIIAPDADEDAKAVLSGKPNLRLMLTGGCHLIPQRIL